MKISDIMEIEQMYAYYASCLSRGDWENIIKLFSHSPEVSFLVVRTENRIIGYENLKKNFLLYDKIFPEYQSFHSTPVICTPCIQISEDGQHAYGMFPTVGRFIHGNGSSAAEAQRPVDSTHDLWYDEFVKEDGVWKILHFNFISMIAVPAWSWNPSVDTGYAAKERLRELPEPFGAKGKYAGGSL